MKGSGERAATRPPATSASGDSVDPSLPRWVCQKCRAVFCVSGVEPYAADAARLSGMQVSFAQGSLLGASRMDNSYVVLPKHNRHHGHSMPRPHMSIPMLDENQSTRMMESYVVLPHAADSMYKGESAKDSGGGQPSNPDGQNFGFHSSVTILQRAFEMVASQAQVDQPLCLECLKIVCKTMDLEVEDINRDIKEYESCLQKLESLSFNVLSEAEFLKEKEKIEEEERDLEAAIQEAEKQYAEVSSEMNGLQEEAKAFEELEKRYWRDFNDFQFQIGNYQEQRDAISAKIEVSQAHLELLKRTNVLNDAFYISHDGEFGTINNFRLGRLPAISVEWDEINAAWGQACLLLHTMAQFFRPKFSYKIKIIPMGSYPRIMDINNKTYELFGPVNLFWSTKYDNAMTLFLACLKEFAEFANARDHENNIPAEKCFRLPYEIENDKVKNYTITLSFNKPENWTKALKYMLCDLKWVLYWFVGNTYFQPLSPASASRADISPSGSMNVK